MINNYLAIITARSGSRRLRNKNILDLCGKPMFVWSILAGLNCKKIDETIVTTDSEVYRKIAISYGANCPVLRSKELSGDFASSADVVTEVLESCNKAGKFFNNLILLQPTSPLRTEKDVGNAIDEYEASGAPALVSVSKSECNPNLIHTLTKDNLLEGFLKNQDESKGSNSNYYRINGAIYIINTASFLKEKNFFPSGTKAFIMSREKSVDVDTEFDFNLAKILMSKNLEGEG